MISIAPFAKTRYLLLFLLQPIPSFYRNYVDDFLSVPYLWHKAKCMEYPMIIEIDIRNLIGWINASYKHTLCKYASCKYIFDWNSSNNSELGFLFFSRFSLNYNFTNINNCSELLVCDLVGDFLNHVCLHKGVTLSYILHTVGCTIGRYEEDEWL